MTTYIYFPHVISNGVGSRLAL